MGNIKLNFANIQGLIIPFLIGGFIVAGVKFLSNICSKKCLDIKTGCPGIMPKYGTKIAFYGYDGSDNEIYSINSDGTGLIQLTDNSFDDYSPQWDPGLGSQLIEEVASKVTELLNQNSDPYYLINLVNSKYTIRKADNNGTNALINTGECENCDLSFSDLSNQNLSASLLGNAILNGVDFSNSDLAAVNWLSRALSSASR